MRNLTLYNLPIEEEKLKALQEKLADRYMEKCHLVKIPFRKFLVGPRNLQTRKWLAQLMRSGVRNTRSTSIRTPRSPGEWESLQSELGEIRSKLNEWQIVEWEHITKMFWADYIRLTAGKPYKEILNSKFCHIRIFHLFKHIIQQDWKEADHPAKRIPDTLKSSMVQDKQDTLLKEFLSAVPGLAKGGNFEMINVPFLSRLAVGSLWIVAVLFEKVMKRFRLIQRWALLLYLPLNFSSGGISFG